jgi:hypothetical protein
MKIYFLPKHTVKRYVITIIIFSFNASSILNLWLSSERQWNDWSNISLLISFLIFVFGTIFYAKSIYEPSLKIKDDKIKIESPYTILETSVNNLSHIEVKMERPDKLGDYEYQFIRFKEPVKSYIRFLGINLWKVSNSGFRLDIVDEKAREEIKMEYIKGNSRTIEV